MITAVLLLALAQDPAALTPPPVDSPPDTLYTKGPDLRLGRFIGTLAAGVGIILLGVATGFFAEAASLERQRHLVCPANPCTEPAAYDLYARAGTRQNFAVLFTSLGGGLFAAGAVLFFFKADF